MNVTLRGEAFGFYANPIEIGVICAPVDVSGVPAGIGTSIDTKVLHVVVCLCRYFVSYHTLCHLQPYPTKTSALQLEPGLDSQMLRHAEACQVTYLWYQSSMMTLLNRASP